MSELDVLRDQVQAALDKRTPYDLAMTFFAIGVAKIDAAVLSTGIDPVDVARVRAGLDEGLKYVALGREALARGGLACDERYDSFILRAERVAGWLLEQLAALR